MRKFFGDVGAFRAGELGAFHECVGIFSGGKFAGVIQECFEAGGTILHNLVIPGGGGITGQIENVGKILSVQKRYLAEVEHAGHENDTVDGHVATALQKIYERGGAESFVAFTDKKLRRIPAV